MWIVEHPQRITLSADTYWSLVWRRFYGISWLTKDRNGGMNENLHKSARLGWSNPILRNTPAYVTREVDMKSMKNMLRKCEHMIYSVLNGFRLSTIAGINRLMWFAEAMKWILKGDISYFLSYGKGITHSPSRSTVWSSSICRSRKYSKEALLNQIFISRMDFVPPTSFTIARFLAADRHFLVALGVFWPEKLNYTPV